MMAVKGKMELERIKEEKVEVEEVGSSLSYAALCYDHYYLHVVLVLQKENKVGVHHLKKKPIIS